MRWLVILILLLPCPTLADVRVIDGDSLDVNGQHIRLHGIDAPESNQTCWRDGVAWACGQRAAAKLHELVWSGSLRCDPQDRDRYGRTIAVCWAGKIDVGAEMVSAGLALADTQYSAAYLPREDAAWFAERGVWAGPFVRPWDWRRGERRPTSPNGTLAVPVAWFHELFDEHVPIEEIVTFAIFTFCAFGAVVSTRKTVRKRRRYVTKSEWRRRLRRGRKRTPGR